MELKNLRNKEDFRLGDKKYFISSIPAVAASKILFKAVGALNTGNLSALPQDIFLELLSYGGGYNQNGAEVQFVDEMTIDMFVEDPMDLFEVATRIVEKNFGFLGDGRLIRAIERLSATLSQVAKREDTPNT